ncbi:MAG: lysozyme inhibitor LprI family protein [Alphaproteobacteria bacterium]
MRTDAAARSIRTNATLVAACLAAGTAAGAWPDPAAADPSFDCSRATTPTELAICASPVLAKLDQQIADVYFALLEGARPTLAAQIRHQQRAYLRETNACAAGNQDEALDACIAELMRTRLGELNVLHAELTGAPLVSGGDVVTAGGWTWRAARPGEIPAGAFVGDDGHAVCAVGLPDSAEVGVVADDGSGCRIARNGAAAVEPAFSVLIDSPVFTWAWITSVNAVPSSSVVAWSSEDDMIGVCRANVDGIVATGSLALHRACTVLHVADGGATEEILVLGGFEALIATE